MWLAKAAISLCFIVLSAHAQQWQQWNWNPFAYWGNLGVANAPAQTTRATAAEIYGTPGTRNPSQKLRSCCRSLKDADVTCRRKYCDFDKFSSSQLVLFLTECMPKPPTVWEMWNCVSSAADHTQCCWQQGVLPMCMPYCDATKPVPTDFAKYGICLSQFDKIRQCFYSYMESHPNIKGDY